MRTVPFKWVALGIVLVALLLAGVVSFYASSSPDGLNRVAQDHGFAQTAKDHEAARGPFAGYATKDVGHARLSGGLAGSSAWRSCWCSPVVSPTSYARARQPRPTTRPPRTATTTRSAEAGTRWAPGTVTSSTTTVTHRSTGLRRT